MCLKEELESVILIAVGGWNSEIDRWGLEVVLPGLSGGLSKLRASRRTSLGWDGIGAQRHPRPGVMNSIPSDSVISNFVGDQV